MANDDIPTPTKLVGKKIAPIFVSNDRVTFMIAFLLFGE
jgi:glutaredoxin 2